MVSSALMGDMRAQITLRTVDSVPANFITNTLAFTGEDSEESTTEITTAIRDFYDDVASYLSPVLSTTGHLVKFYNLPGVVPNYPFEETTFNLTAGISGTALPDELAICMSFQGARAAGFPQARRRGRIYVGPLDATANTGNRPAAGLISALAVAGATFGANIDAITGDVQWAVWSKVDLVCVPVVDGWVDNAFDVQRRRGVLPSSRTTFVA